MIHTVEIKTASYERVAKGSCFSIDDEFEEHHSACAVLDCEDEILFIEPQKRLLEAINSLNKKQCKRMISHFVDGKIYREIGKVEGVDHKAIVHCVEAAIKNF